MSRWCAVADSRQKISKKTFYRLERICIIYLTVKRYVIPNLARWCTRVLRRMLTCKTGGEGAILIQFKIQKYGNRQMAIWQVPNCLGVREMFHK